MKTQIVIALSLALTGTALADAHSEKKAPARKAPDIKKEAPPAAAMTQPKAPAEVGEMMKMMAGNWRCTGKAAMDPAKPTEMSDFKGTYRAALDLDKFWIKGTWIGSAGKLKMKGYQFITYDPMSKKWHRMMVDNWGMSGTETSTGLPAGAKDGKMVWEGESRMFGQTIKGRTTEQVAAKQVSMTVEMSPDGRKWVTGMEMTCKK